MKKSLLLFIFLFAFALLAKSQINWTMGMNISNNTFGNMHPRIVLDRNSNPLVIWGRMSDESVFFSKWNGVAFTTPVKLNGTLTIATASWMGPDIASYGDTLFVVMKATPEADTASHIFMVHSYDGGMSFSIPVQVEQIADSISRFPAVTADQTGNPLVAFMKFNSSFGDSRWVVTRSNDYGNTFNTDVKASGWGGSQEVCDCCPGAIATDGNNCAVLYRDNNNNLRDIWMGVSYNNGVSFSNGCNIDNNNWMLNSCPASGPDGTIISDTLYSVFMNGSSGVYRTYWSKSSVSAVSLNQVSPVTGAIAGLGQQNYPRIASYGNAVGIVWRQIVNGNVQLPVLFTSNIANGFPMQYDTVDLGDITNADIAVSNGNVFVVWQDDNSQTVKYRTGTFTPSTTGLPEQQATKSFSVSPNPVTNHVTIHLNNEAGQISITNILGQIVYSDQIFGNKQINTSTWNHGIYFIRVQIANQLEVIKFIKL